MLYCADCQIRNCTKKIGEENLYPENCPSLSTEMELYLHEYGDALDRLIAVQSSICSLDHRECRILKTIRFAKECGFKKLGLAFCITLAKEAHEVNKILRNEGFQVESVICKVGHVNRDMLGLESCVPMCNPIAQAEMLNRAGTELNILLGLCVGHDSLFIRHSKAPVTILAAKDHVYDNAPLRYLEEESINKPNSLHTEVSVDNIL